MEIASPVAHRLLAYVEAVTEQGHRLTIDEFEAYAAEPEPIVRQIPGSLNLSAKLFSGLLSQLQGSVEAESQIDWLTRLRWIREAEDVVSITALGRAVLRSLDAQQQREDPPVNVTLAAKDPLSYARVIGRIASLGESLLVDPYFGLDHFQNIASQTGVRRILIGDKQSGTKQALSIALATLPKERAIEIRVGPKEDMHDRYVIPAAGPVLFLGTSLTGVGKTLTAMGEIDEPAASQIRQAFDRAWQEGTPIEPARPPEK